MNCNIISNFSVLKNFNFYSEYYAVACELKISIEKGFFETWKKPNLIANPDKFRQEISIIIWENKTKEGGHYPRDYS